MSLTWHSETFECKKINVKEFLHWCKMFCSMPINHKNKLQKTESKSECNFWSYKTKRPRHWRGKKRTRHFRYPQTHQNPSDLCIAISLKLLQQEEEIFIFVTKQISKKYLEWFSSMTIKYCVTDVAKKLSLTWQICPPHLKGL